MMNTNLHELADVLDESEFPTFSKYRFSVQIG